MVPLLSACVVGGRWIMLLRIESLTAKIFWAISWFSGGKELKSCGRTSLHRRTDAAKDQLIGSGALCNISAKHLKEKSRTCIKYIVFIVVDRRKLDNKK